MRRNRFQPGQPMRRAGAARGRNNHSWGKTSTLNQARQVARTNGFHSRRNALENYSQLNRRNPFGSIQLPPFPLAAHLRRHGVRRPPDERREAKAEVGLQGSKRGRPRSEER